MIKIDLKAAKLPLILYGAIFIAYLSLLLFYPRAMTFAETRFETYKSYFFYWSDFICPLAAVFCIILQLGNTLEKKSFEFLCSLPERTGIIERWLFTLFALILPVYLAGVFACRFAAAGEPFAFWELLYLTGANLAFYSTLSLLMMIIFKQAFYVFSITCGLMFADLAAGEYFLFEYSAFLNISCRTPMETVEVNRRIYYAASLAMLVISFIFVKTNLLKRSNKLR